MPTPNSVKSPNNANRLERNIKNSDVEDRQGLKEGCGGVSLPATNQSSTETGQARNLDHKRLAKFLAFCQSRRYRCACADHAETTERG